MSDARARQTAEPFTRLGKRAQEELAKLGLRVLGFSIDPPLGDGPLRFRIAVVIDEALSPGDPDLDAALAGMLAATDAQESDRRAEEARQKLAELGDVLKDRKRGILGE